MEEFNRFKETLENKRPTQWELLPDIELYMDQLLTYVNRQQADETRDVDLTKSMVNNYIKQGIVRRPNGKRYTKEHIAELTILSMLKEVLPIQQCQELFLIDEEEESIEEIYGEFLTLLDESLSETSSKLQLHEDIDKKREALMFAIFSYTSRKAAIALLKADASEKNAKTKNKREKNK